MPSYTLWPKLLVPGNLKLDGGVGGWGEGDLDGPVFVGEKKG